MRVLIIGRDGQLARSLAEATWPVGARPIFVGRPEVELARLETLDKVVSRHLPDLIINTAAYTAVDRAESEPELAYTVNAEAPGRLADLAERRGVPLIHISTDYVFDGAKATAYVEHDATAPKTAYGLSKLEGERLVLRQCSRGLILRTAWVYSQFGTNFAKTMLRLAASRAELGVVADQIGSPTYAPHLAEAIVEIAASALQTVSVAAHVGDASTSPMWGIYHVAGSGEASWHELAVDVFARSAAVGGPSATALPITTAEYPKPARRPPNSRLNCTKLGATFGLRLPVWQRGVAAFIDTIAGQSVETRKPQLAVMG